MKGRAARVISAAVLLAGACGAPRSAAADDGAYGRLDGDLDLSIGAGAGVAAGSPVLAARGSAVYVAMTGLYLGYADALGQTDARIDRSIAAGVTLKPLFWGRFANVLEGGPARLDLFIDSLVFELGAFWAAPRDRGLQAEPGMEIAIGLGFPILADATGPFIEVRAALRYHREDLTGLAPYDVLDRGGMLTVTLAWHHIVAAHIADAGDRLTR